MDTIQNIQAKVNANLAYQYTSLIDLLSAYERQGLTLRQSIEMIEKLKEAYTYCGMCESGYKCDKHS